MQDMQEQDQNNFTSDNLIEEESIGNNDLFTCTGKCKRTFKSEETYDNHIAGIKQCNECKQTFCHPSNLKRHYQRTRCKKNLPKMNRTVTKARDYSCDICGKAFILKGHLNRHQRSRCCQSSSEKFVGKMNNHSITIERPYHCDDCSSSFIEKYQLKSHIARVHNKQKTNSCDVCAKSFFAIGDLNRHKFLHTGERPFTCDHCDGSFYYKSNLKIHKRRMHNICVICDEALETQDSLKDHMKAKHGSHSLFTCDKCPKSFNEHRNFIKHKTEHDGGKPFTCDICSQMFGSKSAMIRHEIIIHRKYEKSDCSQQELLNTKSLNRLKDQNRNIVENVRNKSDKRVFRNLSEGFCDKENLKDEFKKYFIKVHKSQKENVANETSCVAAFNQKDNHQVRIIQEGESSKVKLEDDSLKVNQEEDSLKVNQEEDSSKVKHCLIQKPKVVIEQCTNQYFSKEEFNVFNINQVNVLKVYQEVGSNVNNVVTKIVKDDSLKDDNSKINHKVLAEVKLEDNVEVNQRVIKEVKQGTASKENISNKDNNQPKRRRCARFQRPKIPKPFPCSMCDLAFNRRMFLTKHMELLH